jgi:hypothetical protein
LYGVKRNFVSDYIGKTWRSHRGPFKSGIT